MRHVFTFATACCAADWILLSVVLIFRSGNGRVVLPLARLNGDDVYTVHFYVPEICYLIREVL